MSASTYSPAPRGRWTAPRAAGALHAQLRVPGSKSLTNRELVLAAIADGPGLVTAPLHSDDSARMIDALRALGIGVEEERGSGEFGPDLRITPARLTGGGTVDCGQAGTVMRFVAPLAGLADGDVLLTAHETALHRPMGAMIHALRDLGIDVEDHGSWSLPFTIRGRGHIRGGRVEIDASASSQFVSGLLLAAPRFDVGLHLVHTGERLPSMPHIDMTVEALTRRGIKVTRPAPGEWMVEAGSPRARETAIEPDLSNAAPFVGLAAVTGGVVTVRDWAAETTQAGDALRDLLTRLGCEVRRDAAGLTVAGDGHLAGIDADLHDVGELTPAVAALCALATTPSHLRGIGHIRGHETDRLAALATELGALGADVTEHADGLSFRPARLHGGTFHTYADHRMAHAGVLVGAAVDGVAVEDVATTSKTFPDFAPFWASLF
jgi:3-phosphoshikimate 1-carboxyvinyltransferase